MKLPARTITLPVSQAKQIEEALNLEMERLDDLYGFFKMMEEVADKASAHMTGEEGADVQLGYRALFSYLARLMRCVHRGVSYADMELLEALNKK